METRLTPEILNTTEGQEAEAILRSCVHCGFCNATCPTYQLIGDENDGPRGRIYLIKQILEGKKTTSKTLDHLDRCLTCRNCETTCPSGVQYSKLLDIGRNAAEKQVVRPLKDKVMRSLLLKILPHPARFSVLLGTGRFFKPFLLPKSLAKKIPNKTSNLNWPEQNAAHTIHKRKMLILDGCVQPAMSPDINAATAIVLDKLGITLIRVKKTKCCGAVSQHLSAEEEALQFMRTNIDAWWNDISNGVEAIVSTASGCGVMLKDYYHYLKHDPEYADKAEKVSNLCKDIAEILIQENIQSVSKPKTLAWHPPCTLQHGQKITGVVEKILTRAGHTLVPVTDQHLCCGSAGTYSILQPEISNKLRENKLGNLLDNKPEMIVTANIGCQTHLQENSEVPVVHWVTLFA